MKHDTRVATGEPIDDRGDETRCQKGSAADPHLPGRGIGEKLDALHALTQVIENRHAAIDQRVSLSGQLDALAVAIKQSHTERILKGRDRSRNRGLGTVEARRCLAHAARLHDGHQDVQVLELQAASDAIAQLHGSTHVGIGMRSSKNIIILLWYRGLSSGQGAGTRGRPVPDDFGEVPRLSAADALERKPAMRSQVLAVVATSVLSWSTIGLAGPAFAQTADELVGTWRPASVVNTRPDGTTLYPFGPNPKGILVFERSGHFAFILNRPDLPRFATNNRLTGNAEENKAIVHGSFAYFGRYTLANKVVTMHVEGGTWPAWIGTELERVIISFAGDEMKWTDPSPSLGGKVENAWVRNK